MITVGDLTHLVGTERIRLLDAREADDYANGHIPGAFNLHPSSLEHTQHLESGERVTNQLRSVEEIVPYLRSAGVRSDVPVCIYDEGGGYLAARIWWVLDCLGHPRVRLLDGGYFVWCAEEGTTIDEPAPPGTGNFVPRPVPARRLDFSSVITLVGQPDTVLCNTLLPDSYYAGAIPASTNFPYSETFAEDNYPLLKSRHELAAALAERGITHRHHIVCYCQIGYSAAQVYFAARYAGFPRVGLYDGSIVDWTARGGELVPGSESGG